MTLTSPPAQQLAPIVPLTGAEVEVFLDSLVFDKNTVHHTVDQLHDAFRKLTGETQRLLVRNVERGVLHDHFVYQRIDEFCYSLFMEWDESGKFESLEEATAIFDNRTYSTLRVLEYLGSSLDPLDHSVGSICMWAEGVLNDLVDVDEDEYPEVAAYRLSTVEEVAEVAAKTTYVAVDGVLHDKELLAHRKDTTDILVEIHSDVFPRCSDAQGTHIAKNVIKHPELEIRLRGRSLSDYEDAMRFVRVRGLVGASSEDAEYVLATLNMTRPLSSGIL